MSESEAVPTVSNLATAAGVPVNKMQTLVDNQKQAKYGQARLPPRSNNPYNSNGVEICRNYHYHKVCLRGVNCRFAHELVPANVMRTYSQAQSEASNSGAVGGARALSNALGGIQRQPPPPLPPHRPRSRSVSTERRQYVSPVYHPEHPDYERIMAMSANDQTNQVNQADQQANNVGNNLAGNATEYGNGAAHTQNSGPQVIRPTLVIRPQLEPRVRTVSTSASSDSEARRNIQQNMSQQASDQNRMRAMKDQAWKHSMDSVMNIISRTYTRPAGERRNSSAETSEFTKDQE